MTFRTGLTKNARTAVPYPPSFQDSKCRALVATSTSGQRANIHFLFHRDGYFKTVVENQFARTGEGGGWGAESGERGGRRGEVGGGMEEMTNPSGDRLKVNLI